MNAYACTECRWQYDWTMGDRVKAVKRHQLAHLVERYGWRNNIEGAVNSLLAASEAERGVQGPQV